MNHKQSSLIPKPTYQQQLVHIKTSDNVDIALWKIYQPSQVAQHHIFLTHGTFSDKKVCLGIISYFVQKGYTCWIMEWRGHGNSGVSPTPFNFETVALRDVSAVFNYLVYELKIPSISCITHSGGGICLTMFLIKNPKFIPFLKSAVFFGCQAFGAAHNFKNRIQIHISDLTGRLLGYLPARAFGKPHNETYYTMKQWNQWNLSGKFLSDDGSSYQAQMPLITFPILSVCGAGDTVIAPKEGCQAFLEAFDNPKNQLLYCSIQNGYKEDYDHSRILHSSSSMQEIWSIAEEWIKRNFIISKK